MEKLDLIKKHKAYFNAKNVPELVTIEPARFISIRGKGDPSAKPFIDKIEALYPVAYAIKFNYKDQEKDFVVSKLEGLWWFDTNRFPDMTITNSSVKVPREEWEYRLLIRMPEFVSKEDIQKAKTKVIEKKDLTLAKEIEYFEMIEGTCVQILHVGPFSTESESLTKIAAFTSEKRLMQAGLHHEIYLSDFRKTKPEKLKTILREPVKSM
ncbi:MAG: GyrI-like domain-containing protein [Chryseolinea sp.]